MIPKILLVADPGDDALRLLRQELLARQLGAEPQLHIIDHHGPPPVPEFYEPVLPPRLKRRPRGEGLAAMMTRLASQKL